MQSFRNYFLHLPQCLKVPGAIGQHFCIHYCKAQAHIKAVPPYSSLTFSSMIRSLVFNSECSKISCTIFAFPFLHASNILLFNLLTKILSARIFLVCETKRLITFSIFKCVLLLTLTKQMTRRYCNLQVKKCFQIVFYELSKMPFC